MKKAFPIFVLFIVVAGSLAATIFWINQPLKVNQIITEPATTNLEENIFTPVSMLFFNE
jgi:hypothetical protein